MFRKARQKDETIDYWMSYSDLMAGVLLIIILFLFVAILNYNEDKDKLEEQQALLEEKEEEIEILQLRIDELVGMRKNIILQLIDAFDDSNVEVEIDSNTGDIKLSSGVFFDLDSYHLKESGRQFLGDFLPIYLRVLLSEKNKKYISEIIIEGHTDDVGSYLYNLELSQQRALEVSKFIHGNEFRGIENNEKALLEQVLTSNGKSFSQLIFQDNEVDREASRRVEFRFRMKDTELIDEMDQIIRGVI